MRASSIDSAGTRALHDAAHGGDDLGPGPVVEGHVEDQAGVVPGQFQGLLDAPGQGGRDAVQGAQVPDLDAVLVQLGASRVMASARMRKKPHLVRGGPSSRWRRRRW